MSGKVAPGLTVMEGIFSGTVKSDLPPNLLLSHLHLVVGGTTSGNKKVAEHRSTVLSYLLATMVPPASVCLVGHR